MVKRWLVGVIVTAALWHSPVRSAQEQPQGRPDAISVRTASVDGLNIQYLLAGRGPNDRVAARVCRNVSDVATAHPPAVG